MTGPRLAFWLLAAAGTGIAHVLGYAIAHPDDPVGQVSAGSHGYLPGVLAAVVPVGAIVAGVHAVRLARRIGVGDSLSVRRLTLAQLALFALQEVGERLASSVGVGGLVDSLVAEPGVWVGILAQGLVAFALVTAVGLAARVVRALTGTVARRVAGSSGRDAVPIALPLVVRLVPVVPAGVRGPPVRVLP